MKRLLTASMLAIAAFGLQAETQYSEPTPQFSEPIKKVENGLKEVDYKVETFAGRWTKEKAATWYAKQPWLVGCNYIPANAINQIEMFHKDTFDPNTIDKELKWADELGFNTLRVYLHDLLWMEDEQGMYARMDQFMGISDKYGMKILWVFFDDCHRANPTLGKQPPMVKEYHNSGWLQSPGRDLNSRYHDGKATDAEKARLKGYVQQTMKRFKDDKRVLAWELYNEPGRSCGLKSVTLLNDAWRWAREINPSQPITSTAEGSNGKIFIDIARANSDVISFHCYRDAAHKRLINIYKKLGYPALCTEFMARPGSTFEKVLPVSKENKVGMYCWGFVAGKTGTIYPWSSRRRKNLDQLRLSKEHTLQPEEAFPEPKEWFHDILRVDGTPYSQAEVDFIKSLTGKK